MRYTLMLSSVVACLVVTATAPAADLRVPSQFSSIQLAINAAEDGDSVLVDPGTYAETIDLAGKAISVRSTDGPSVTTIDGGAFDGSVVTCHSNEGADTRLEGFTITGGNGRFLEVTPGRFQLVGGGMLNNGTSPTVRNCIFDSNTASRDLDGIVAEGETVIEDLFFQTYSITKRTRVCIDPPCGGTKTSPTEEACDPFPDDGMYTYLYTLESDELGSNDVIGWRLATDIPGAIVEAGFIVGDGIEPCEVNINAGADTAEFWFFGDGCQQFLEPGATTVELYVISPIGPGSVHTTVYGDGALDALGTCLGPARPSETVEVTDLFFNSFHVVKEITVFADSPCIGEAGAGVAGINDNPFADDGYFTYLYKLTNLQASTNDIIGWRIDTGIPGAVIGAGTVGVDGVVPCEVVVNDDLSQVEWYFFDDDEGLAEAGCRGLLEPGSSSRHVYIVSALGPDQVDFTGFGDGAVDAVGRCMGPAVALDACLSQGGGMYNLDAAPEVTNCLFTDNAAGVHPSGFLSMNTTEVTDPQFHSYFATLSTRLCADPTGDNTGDACDPFPNDGMLTYIYRIANQDISSNSLIGWQIFTSTPGAIVDAGFLEGSGVTPDITLVEDDASKVQWNFFSNPIGPGQQSVELYVTSDRRPSQINATVYGDGALDAPAPTIGPTGKSSCGGQGGAVFNQDSTPVFANCTMTENYAASGGAMFGAGSSAGTMTNCILWNNEFDELVGAAPSVTFSDVMGGWMGDGNINEDPIFQDASIGNFRLNVGSPCIDAGANAGVPGDVAVDLDGLDRFVDDAGLEDVGEGDAPLVDMGAFESQVDTPPTCQWDLVINFVVDSDDLALVIANYDDPGGPGDGNGDGVVDVDDLIGVIVNWGPCPDASTGDDYDTPDRAGRRPTLDAMMKLISDLDSKRVQVRGGDAIPIDLDEIVEALFDRGVYADDFEDNGPSRGRRSDQPSRPRRG